ncbi:hypothetical protein HY415_00320 [Candidatus Kaiserbacteria bacterium]|nr:hypothetical protein [Candidatus Kaiserbacteria bacterium]
MSDGAVCVGCGVKRRRGAGRRGLCPPARRLPVRQAGQAGAQNAGAVEWNAVAPRERGSLSGVLVPEPVPELVSHSYSLV